MATNATACAFNIILEARKVLKQSVILAKQRFDLSKIGKNDRTDIKARYKLKKSRFERKKRGEKSRRARKDKENKSTQSFSLSNC